MAVAEVSVAVAVAVQVANQVVAVAQCDEAEFTVAAAVTKGPVHRLQILA